MTVNPPKVLLRSEQSGGHIAIVELIGGGRPPLHHHDFDETFYVFEGELTFQLGDDIFTRRTGELAFAPRGVPHTYANLSGAPARALLVIHQPASNATSTVSQRRSPASSRRPRHGNRSPTWSRPARHWEETGRDHEPSQQRSRRRTSAVTAGSHKHSAAETEYLHA